MIEILNYKVYFLYIWLKFKKDMLSFEQQIDLQGLIKQFKTIVQKLYGKRLAKIILYGSYARGNFHTESDIDFLVVLHDSTLHIGREIRNLAHVIAPLSMQYGVWISNYPTTFHKYQNSDYLFYENIRKEGVEI